MNKNGMQEIEEVMASTAPADQPLKDLITDIEKTNAAIQRLEKAETAREVAGSQLNEKATVHIFSLLTAALGSGS